MKTAAQNRVFENLWEWLQALAFFKIPRCWMTTTGTNFLSK